MDPKKLLTFLRKTDEDIDIQARQARYDKELEKKSAEIERDKNLVLAMVKSKGWQLVGEWKDTERDNLLNRLYKEVKERDFKKAEKTAADIEAINKLYASILNIIGPQAT